MEYTEIEKKARELFEKSGALIPVPVVAVAQELGIRVHEVAMPKIEGIIPSGMIVEDNGEWVIIVNEEDAPTRKRFTIAHEIGHFMLHSGKTFVDEFSAGETFYRDHEKNGQEREANHFAANLLIPAKELTEQWPDFADPAEAAEYYYVSEVSMTYRLKNLGLIQDSP
jgi:Zn-dependent peptidase ImmA (M78 family)